MGDYEGQQLFRGIDRGDAAQSVKTACVPPAQPVRGSAYSPLSPYSQSPSLSAALTPLSHTHQSPGMHVHLPSGHTHCHTLCFKKLHTSQLTKHDSFSFISFQTHSLNTYCMKASKYSAPSTKTNETSSAHKEPQGKAKDKTSPRMP